MLPHVSYQNQCSTSLALTKGPLTTAQLCFILSWTDQVMQYAPLNVERYTQPRLTGYPKTAYPLMQLYAKLP